MTTEDWPRVEELFHNASQLGVAERDEYLARECAGDATLRREVESLITTFESNRSFMEESLVSEGLRVLYGGPAGSLAGSSLGHYKILRMLDGGGMGGEVYLAEDCRLERPVALKFISNHYAGDEWAREQMMKEARAVARLEHPHICPVYGVEEIDGHHFIVMQYVEGETLASLMRRGRIGPERAAALAEQIAGALAFAHARRVIHRDVKPQNIMVTTEGQAKVLDFGLAQFVRPQREEGPGGEDPEQTLRLDGVVGTPAYMSPEQARGEELDFRSDIFSFGVVFYEMLTGRNPFLRNTVEETVAAVRSDEPSPLPSSGVLGEIALQCLAKERARRPESADALLRRLRGRSRFPYLRRHARHLAAATLALLLLLSSLAVYVYVKLSRIHTLAVLPITNVSEDREADYLSVGLTRSLSDKFSYLPRLKLKLPSVVPSGGDEQGDLAKLGRELNVDAVLSGRVFKQGDSLWLRLSLLSAPDASQLWEGTFDLNNAASVFRLQDEVTKQVSSHLDMWLVSGERRLLTKRQTDNEEALRLYMRGRYYWSRTRSRENIQEAIRLFDRAVELDPSFAKAYTGLADCYALTTNVAYGPAPRQEAMEKARYNARQALALDDSLPEAHTSMGLILMNYSLDRQGAEGEFRRAIDLDPGYAQAHFLFSNLLAVSGHFDESVSESGVARGLDPYSPQAELNYGRALYYARRFDEAEAHFDRLLEKSPEHPGFLRMKGFLLARRGRNEEAIAFFQKAYAKDPRLSAAGLGYAYGRAGRHEEARAMLRELDALSTPERPMPAFEYAVIYIGMGDRDSAFRMLERAYDEQFFQLLVYFTIDPFYDDLRSDPRYADFARRLNLTP
ncbi:MAG: eukaryotic-like serine/threonine-protein kinase [Acidobacteriota bacterium]|nr:eukaryotic-like serine/threonine-protein kinase [Acidobacteriota bacterium]